MASTIIGIYRLTNYWHLLLLALPLLALPAIPIGWHLPLLASTIIGIYHYWHLRKNALLASTSCCYPHLRLLLTFARGERGANLINITLTSMYYTCVYIYIYTYVNIYIYIYIYICCKHNRTFSKQAFAVGHQVIYSIKQHNIQ